MKLKPSDYKAILQYYKIDISKMSHKAMKEKAEHLLATKLCKCIKKVNTDVSKGEKRAIAICYDSVIRRKNLKTFRFKCKNGAKLLPKKGTRKIIVKKLGTLFS
jgi:hypothetical protein